ncbi:MAG: M20/M25/M40 family metallo-hydrolase [Bdellovibrionaceae bacterium]|nr:M20/M25/M40 family metallo-hydrolase [Pseudobdellovibrionaceae bacterium]MDW8189786.1 M20/M25/M40 family metallo-hydrolase [Pseudobdellovibrionaceae bacterium]
MGLLELLRILVTTPSTWEHGSAEIAQRILEVAHSLGLHVTSFPEAHRDRMEFNVMVTPFALDHAIWKNTPVLLLLNHLDTRLGLHRALWKENQGNPFQIVIHDGAYWGLGVAEQKADLACKLLALRDWHQMVSHHTTVSCQKVPIWVGTFGHYQGFRGLQRWLRHNRFRIDQVWVGHPTELQIIPMSNGYARVEIRVMYEEDELQALGEGFFHESHSSSRLFQLTPGSSLKFDENSELFTALINYFRELPTNTALLDLEGGRQFNVPPHQIYAEVDLVTGKLRFPVIQKLINLFDGFSGLHEKFKKNRNARYVPEHLTFNVGVMRRQESYLLLDSIVRIPPHVTPEELKSWEKEARKLVSQNGCQFFISDYKPPYDYSDLFSEFYQKAQSQLRSLYPQDFQPSAAALGLSHEGCFLARQNIPIAAFGPGESVSNLHSPGERVSIREVDIAYQFYRSWIVEETHVLSSTTQSLG